MADQQVPQQTTPVSEADVVSAFINVANQLWGITLTKPQLSLIVAQNNLETDNRKAMHNYNIGNITHVPGDGFDYYLGGDKTRDAQGNWVPTHLKFRSYDTLEDGAKDYLKNLHARGGGAVWQSILQADPAAFAQSLKKTHYYEADESQYEAGIKAHMNAFNNRNSYEAAVSGAPTAKPDMMAQIENLMNQYLGALSTNQRRYIKKQAIKKLLPNQYLLKIKANYTEDAIEFARVLCAAIDEELYSDAYTHTDGDHVEIECVIPGVSITCTDAILQLSNALATAFEKTADIRVVVCANKRSSYKPIDIATATRYYDAFRKRGK